MKQRGFVPEFVLNEYRKGNLQKELFAHVFAVDISGFTELTQLLMNKGSLGAEKLGKVLKELLTPIITCIEQSRGFISSFSEDSFITIFPDHEVAHIDLPKLSSRIIDSVKEFNSRNKYDLTSLLSIKLGVGFGEVKMDIFESEYYSTYLFSGKGVDSAINALKKATSGEVEYAFPVSKNGHQTAQKTIEYKSDIWDNYHQFLPPPLRAYEKKGGFKRVASCFLSFEKNENTPRFVSRVMELALLYGGFFNKIDYSEQRIVILVIFGVPIEFPDASNRACNFALEISAYQTNNCQLAITYGEVYAGFLGGFTKGRYTVFGRSVNFSAQLVKQATSGEILVDKYIFNKARNNFKIIMKGYRSYAGFPTKVPIYILKNLKHINEFLAFGNKFIGREEDLRRIAGRIIESSANAKAKIFNLYGDEGIGKTRLAAELVNLLGKTNYTWAYMECDPILRQNYNPLICYFKHFFKINDLDDYDTNHTRIVNIINGLATNVKNKTLIHELNSGIALFENMLGIKEFLVDNIDNEVIKSRHENTFYAVTNIFRLISLNSPTVLIIDNFDSIDPESYNFFQYFYPLIKDFPITIAVLSRFEQVELYRDLQIPHENHTYKLESLSDSDAIKLIESFLYKNVKDKIIIADQLLEKIVAQAQGNPFYIEQIMSYVKREKLISAGNHFSEKRFTIPDTLETMILHRIEKFDETFKNIIKTATVLGNKFDRRVLKEMMGGMNISRFLVDGEIENLWYPSLEFYYVFRNSLYRDCIYRLMEPNIKIQIHKKALSSMERIYKNSLSKHYEELIYNSINANLDNESLTYLGLAIDNSIKNHKNGATLKYCEQLLKYINDKQIINEEIMIKTKLKIIEVNLDESRVDISNSGLEELEALIKPGSPEWFKFNYLKAKSLFIQENYQKLVAFTQEIIDKYEDSEYKMYLTVYYLDSLRYLNRGEEFERISIELLEKYLDADNNLFVSRIANLLGVYFMEKSKFYDALHYFKLNLNLIENLNTSSFMASSAHNIGAITNHLGDKYQAKSYYLKALQYAEKTGNRLTKCRIMSDLAMLESKEKNDKDALLLLKEALEIAKLSQNTNQVARILYNLATVYFSQKEYDKAIRYAFESKKIGIEMNNLRILSFVNNIIAQIYAKLGQMELAQELIKENIQIQEKIEDLEGVANSYGVLGILNKQQKRYQEAGENFSKEFNILNSLGSKHGEGTALFNWATCDIELNNIEGARSKLNEALAVFQACNYENGIKLVNKLLGEI